MKYFSLFLVLFSVFILSCGNDSSSGALYSVTFIFDMNGINCEEVGGDNFSLVLYKAGSDASFRKTVKCSENARVTVNGVVSGEYYAEVMLYDSLSQIKRYGRDEVTVDSSTSHTLVLDKYSGGVEITWNASICDEWSLDVFSFNITNSESKPLEADLWGDNIIFNNYEVPCRRGFLYLHNIPADTYSFSVDAYRSEGKYPRAVSGSVKREVILSQRSLVENFDKNLSLTISDIVVTWDFDSRTISESEDPCTVSGVTEVIATLKGEADYLSTVSISCSKERTITFYDVPEGSTALGIVDRAGRYGAEDYFNVTSGFIGKNSIQKQIYLKELN